MLLHFPDNWLIVLILLVIRQILNPTAEFVNPIGMPSREAKAEIEILTVNERKRMVKVI